MKRTPLRLLPLLMVGLMVVSGCAPGNPDLAGARQHMEQGDYDEAVHRVDRAIEAEPNNPQAHALRGDIYRQMAGRAATEAERTEKYEQMMASYTRARELDPTDQRLEVTLMLAYTDRMNTGVEAWNRASEDPARWDDAARAFHHAAVIRPDSAVAHMYHGLALLAGGNTEEAAAPLRRAVDMNVDAVEAYQYLAQIYMHQDRADDAIRVLETGVERFPDEVELQTEMLNVYGQTGQVERALTAYEQVVADHPDDPVLRYNYGSFLLQAGRYREAAEQLERATELDPLRADAFYNLGAAYLNEGIDLHEEIVEMDADAPAIEDARVRRDALLQRAIPPLEQSRMLFEQPRNIEDACSGLFRAYAILRMDNEAREAAECAGIALD